MSAIPRARSLALMTFAAYLTTAAIAAPVTGDAEFTRAASIAVEQAEREDGFSGIMLVARGD